MGTVYPRGNKLWLGYKDLDGRTKYASSGLTLGQEEQAKELLAEIEHRVEAERAAGATTDQPLTVQRYGKQWAELRRRRGVNNAPVDEGRLGNHVYGIIGTMLLSEVRPRHIRIIVMDLRSKMGPAPDQLAPRTVRHVYALLHCMFADALADELITQNPCVLRRSDLPKSVDKNPEWRATAVFDRHEVELVSSSPLTPWDRRVLYTLMFLTGARFGEAAALKWRHFDPTQKPLGKLLITASYDVHKRREKRVKTELTRELPVHPVLAKVLAEWKLRGWAETMGRAPKPDDLIVPSREGRNRNSNTTLRRFHKDLARLGLRKRRQHDMRRTFISLARSDGARADVLERITHGPRGDIMNMYTTLPWALLCEEVLKLRIELVTGKLIQLPIAVGQHRDAVHDHDAGGGHDHAEEADVAKPAMPGAHGLVTTALLQRPDVVGMSKKTERGGRDSNPRPPA
ncbi:MAG: tyrosine-type recombinase/integrase [Myxococcales bacterium]|nr:tyrosine-type recombinase/integrase [Myxococcales bacterium]